jgi:hypothetical protein
MLKRLFIAIALTPIFLQGHPTSKSELVLVTPDSNLEPPIAGIEIIQRGRRTQTYWLYPESAKQ